MSKINKPVNKSISKFRNHKRLETHRKQSLINLVQIENIFITIFSENVSTRQAAQKLQIKYSTAKYIVKNFKSKGNWFEDYQHNQCKQRSIIQNVNIVIDVTDGKILLAKTNHKISYSDFSSLQEEYKNQNLQQTSELIYERLAKIYWHKFHYKEYKDEEMVKRFLLTQHILMKQQQ